MKWFVIACLLAAIGCTDAETAARTSLGSEFRVTLWSGGHSVKQWVSSGKVLTEKDSDGYYFMDKETKKLVRISGDITVEQL